MRIILYISIIIFTGYIGYGMSKYYLQRSHFFCALKMFVNDLKIDINFTERKLTDILSTLKYSCKEVNLLITNYTHAININNVTKENLFIGIEFLSTEEKATIHQFFYSLGKLDVYNQIEMLNAFESLVFNYHDVSKVESKKYGALYTKLGVILGIFILILLI